MASYEENWEIVKKLPGGGQGEASVVRKRGTTDPFYFLKVLKDDNDERRKRIKREISCYQTLAHPNIPKLIDTNLEGLKEGEDILYVVTELVNGENLLQYIQSVKSVEGNAAIEMILRLLDIVSYIHSEETVHRDIKPENIMLRQKDLQQPVLVDFGLSFFEGEEGFTPMGQEIGNRFLRLPEFTAGTASAYKRSPISDVTLCAGVLFYLLTGIYPRQLTNPDGHAPHQTAGGREALSKHSEIDIMSLLDVFDKAFDPIITVRYESAEAMSEILKQIPLNEMANIDPISSEEKIARIKQQMASHEEHRIKATSTALTRASNLWMSVGDQLLREIENTTSWFGGRNLDIPAKQISGGNGLAKASDNSKRYCPEFCTRLQGNELIWSINGNEVFRGLVENFEADSPNITKIIKDDLVSGYFAAILV